jgi:predicted nucleic acid-binding protein
VAWVVDTCVLLDILEDDPEFGRVSARCLKARLDEGLLVCPVTSLELAPAFLGNLAAQRQFLARCGVSEDESFTAADVRCGYGPWHHYIVGKRQRKSRALPKRPIADMMIGAFASRFDGLITRNGPDFRPWFPDLVIVDPMAGSRR